MCPPPDVIGPPIQVSGEWFTTVANRNQKMAANNRLKAARVLMGMTQLQLAEKVGVKEIAVSRIETGRSQPDAGMKRRIADLLQKPAFELFDC
jgi:DNA-binding XRE family transcriptional regulator